LGVPGPAQADLGDFVFKGRGYGHGVGLSQWGSWAAARDGKDFRWILGFYYPGTSLDAQPPTELKVKLSSEPWRSIAELTQDFTAVELTPSAATADLAGSGPAGTLAQAVATGTKVEVFPKEGGLEVSVAGGARQGTYDWIELRPRSGGRTLLRLRAGDTAYPQTEYRGKGRVQPAGAAGRLNAFNLVGLEDYVRAIAEVPDEWSSSAPEAVKAQAVAARTYAVANMSPYLEDNQRDQVYRGYTFEGQHPGIAQAAQATSGLVIRYAGQVISAFFSASSGGYTSMWPSGPTAYLPLKPDPYSLQAPSGNPGYAWSYSLSQTDFSAKVDGMRDTGGRSIHLGTIFTVQVAARETPDQGSHVATFRLTGAAGSAVVGAAELRSRFGYANMRSTLVTEIVNPGFSDVPVGHAYRQQIMRAATEGLVNGYADGTFRPRSPVLRWQFAKMAVSLHNRLVPETPIVVSDVAAAPFTDVPARIGVSDESDWVAAAKAAGLVRGVTETGFEPYEPVRRDQMASMVVRALGLEDEVLTLPADAPSFADLELGATHEREAAYLKNQGVLLGYEDPPGTGRFVLRPGEATRREHIALILCRLLDLPG
jgi:SpoIID/LytB domain protein